MEERIARLKTSQDARKFAANAQRLGHADLETQALERALELQAVEEGYSTPAQQAIAAALYAYEEQQSQVKGRVFRANRTRQMFAKHGTLAAAERMVLSRKPSKGYEVLEGAGLQELSFEAIIDRFPEEFSEAALEASRARLEGRPRAVATPERPGLPPPPDDGEAGDPAEPAPAPAPAPMALDAEALAFIDGFLDPTTWFLSRWLPRYRESIQAIEDALADDRPEDIFELLWKRAENHISNAGQGILKFEHVDELRDELIQVIRDIQADGSPSSFERIVDRFRGWKSSGRISKLPELMIARAFAGVHPSRYHTTVDSSSQDEAIKWFVDHTGLLIPKGLNWAERAQALTAHLDRIGALAGDELVRNIFPWFVVEQVRVRTAPAGIKPGHTPRPLSASADLPAARRHIELRHNALQTALFHRLVEEFGKESVWTEYPTGTGGYADAIVRPKDGRCQLYEIKIAATASAVVRQAMGQLLEYGYRTGGLEPAALFIVGEPEVDEATVRFIARLNAEFNLKIDYMRIVLPDKAEGGA
ncbi:hypothetical protein [Stenotrophomonas sp. PD6]|uniref:hypothetical protein n=1 Tax=Stenotrophomonas sp. PD6 TaxID=3368612 RepID=UPI003BA1029F